MAGAAPPPPDPPKRSLAYTALKYGLYTAFAHVTVPYFIAKASINVALYPVRAVGRTLYSIHEG